MSIKACGKNVNLKRGDRRGLLVDGDEEIRKTWAVSDDEPISRICYDDTIKSERSAEK